MSFKPQAVAGILAVLLAGVIGGCSGTPADDDSSSVSPTPLLDSDGDGVEAAGGDCDDNDKTIYPGAA